jgi:hypothetical protein
LIVVQHLFKLLLMMMMSPGSTAVAAAAANCQDIRFKLLHKLLGVQQLLLQLLHLLLCCLSSSGCSSNLSLGRLQRLVQAPTALLPTRRDLQQQEVLP